MFDLPAAAAIVDQDPSLSMAAKLGQTEPIAAALPKGSSNTQAVGAALRAMINDGTIDAITKRRLGISITDAEDSVPLLRTDPT
jgi:ABC-type amino acid transport substrate-binding protein